MITELTDFWTPLLDEMRYCKHIYAMKFAEKVFPPEPSDLPVAMGSIVEWERDLVETNRENQTAAYELSVAVYPKWMYLHNCQAPMMMPMFQNY